MYEVLIIEDDPMVAMINKQYVSRSPHFHTAAVCRDGAAALEYLKANTVHLCILDMYMPRMNGLALLKKIREEGLPVSVIMVTAANDAATIEEALRYGIVDYLVKPFEPERFDRALQTFLRQQDAFHDLDSLDQKNIDSIMGQSAAPDEELPKGIQGQTLDIIVSFLRGCGGAEMTGEEIADKTGLSRVTIRRYMNYLMEKGTVSGRMNYETGGRPSMLYRIEAGGRKQEA